MTLETISQVRAELAGAGFAEEFVVDGRELRALSSGSRYVPSDLVVAQLMRFEGITSPKEQAAMFALATTDGEPLGTYVPSFRPALSADDAALIAQLHEQAIPESEIRSHSRHDHIAAKFATRDDAQAVVDELRQLGFGSDRLGVAIREGATRVFERDDDHAFVHDTEVGVVVGTVLGFLAGMSIAAVALVPGGVVGLGGLLACGAAGVFPGALFGGYIGEAVGGPALSEREELSTARLERGHVLVAVCSHGHPGTVQAIMERHGGQLLLRPRRN
jgi:hypothetical protein